MDAGTSELAKAPSGRFRRLIPVFALALLFAIGIGFGWFARPARKAPEKKDGPAHFESPESVLGPYELRRKADRLLVAGSPVQSLDLLRTIKPDGRRVLAAHLHYRAALCQEILGRNDLALAGYRQAGNDDGGEPMRSAILLAQARHFFRDKRYSEARTLVQGLTLDERQSGVPSIFRQDARMLVALALAEELLAESRHDALGAAFQADYVFAPYRYADDLPPFAKSEEKRSDETASEEKLEIQTAEGKEPRVKSIRWIKKNGVAFLDDLAKASGATIEWSDRAKAQAKERDVTAAVDQWTCSELAQCVADSLELACVVEKNVLRVRTASELSPAEAAQHREAFAERMLLAVLRAEPDHPGAGRVMLRLADLAAHRKKPEESEIWLKRLVSESPNSHWAVPAHLGLATRRIDDGNLAAAARHLFQAIDLSPGNDVTVHAYLRIGQTYLEEGDPAVAVRHLLRARKLATGSPLLPRVTLFAASAQLALEDADAAQNLLVADRILLRKPEFEKPYAFLNAYAHYRAARAQRMGRRESRDLYEAVKAQGNDANLGRWGFYLQARAMLDMNLPLEALPIAESALASARGPIADPLRYARAEALAQLQKKTEAEKEWSMLESSAAQPWRRLSVWQLVQLDLEQDRNDDCLRRCRMLWYDDPPDRNNLLRVWGEAWRRKGDFAKAAMAFGGAPPE